MATNTDPDESGFVPFFRQYTKTWIHTVSTVGLTAFGMLTFVNNWFALLALVTYVIPPIVLYWRKLRRHEREAASAAPSESATQVRDSTVATTDAGGGDTSPRGGDAVSSGSDVESEPESQPGSGPKPAAETGSSSELESEAESETGAETGSETGAEAESETESTVETDAESAATRAGESADQSARKAAAGHAASTGEETTVDQSNRAVDHADGTADHADGAGDQDDEAADHSEGETRAQAHPTQRDREHDGGDTGRQNEDTDDERSGWHSVDVADVTAESTLLDVVIVGAQTSYAVGTDGLVVADTGGGWDPVLEDGPTAQGNTLHGVDATSDGDAVWVAGDNGALGRLETESTRHTDYTAPAGRTDNLAGIAVGGPAGAETVLLINGSGEVLRGQYDEGALEWDDPVTPGSGSSLAAVELVETEDNGSLVGYCCDTNDGVFETLEGGQSFDRVGLEGADGTLAAIATAGESDCLVGADDGVVHRYDGPGTWTSERVAADGISGLARRGDGGRTLVCTTAGDVYERSGDASDWERSDLETSRPLRAIALGSDRAVAVGDEGLILESVSP
ncbi:hypothetical protein G6M89_14460 [Natronolimnobius sp. AArcel1]|uniref:hypothetical protein n=1 Tax=Natronolimnobius sp. AArcel1 TaxID=1679093 RepID=UPI0013EBF750|nr:hypothetical protein [Natronolimnobius sp. AArcel1]NGM70197.1 hypothetical protein [Natronolimnobius sp. AArcel1]